MNARISSALAAAAAVLLSATPAAAQKFYARQHLSVEKAVAGAGYTDYEKWTVCAYENGTCNYAGEVRYGTDGAWSAMHTSTGSIGCNNDVFGDPAYGTGKRCEYRDGTVRVNNPDPAPPYPTGDDVDAEAKWVAERLDAVLAYDKSFQVATGTSRNDWDRPKHIGVFEASRWVRTDMIFWYDHWYTQGWALRVYFNDQPWGPFCTALRKYGKTCDNYGQWGTWIYYK
jgi:hypothetical protein